MFLNELSSTYLVNQPAYEVISERFSPYCFIAEREIEIKHEGRMLAYEVKLSGKEHKPAPPDWITETSQEDGNLSSS
jgi:hypothetical protein